MYLWRGGVPAGVIPVRGGGSLAPTSDRASKNLGLFDVMISSKDQADRAAGLLHEMDASPAEFETGWEQSQTRPDLSRLDPALAPPCPKCGRVLPMDSELSQCRACRAPVDVADLILQAHGPEALADAFDHAPMIPEEFMRDSPVPCPKCGYPLGGLPLEGVCPECGGGYRKVDIVRYWFG
jgi:Double zinc ribbon